MCSGATCSRSLVSTRRTSDAESAACCLSILLLVGRSSFTASNSQPLPHWPTSTMTQYPGISSQKTGITKEHGDEA